MLLYLEKYPCCDLWVCKPNVSTFQVERRFYENWWKQKQTEKCKKSVHFGCPGGKSFGVRAIICNGFQKLSTIINKPGSQWPRIHLLLLNVYFAILVSELNWQVPFLTVRSFKLQTQDCKIYLKFATYCNTFMQLHGISTIPSFYICIYIYILFILNTF